MKVELREVDPTGFKVNEGTIIVNLNEWDKMKRTRIAIIDLDENVLGFLYIQKKGDEISARIIE